MLLSFRSFSARFSNLVLISLPEGRQAKNGIYFLLSAYPMGRIDGIFRQQKVCGLSFRFVAYVRLIQLIIVRNLDG